MRIGGLFEGYGGLTTAVQDVMGGDLAWYSENDPAATKVLAHHHPGVPNLGDITTVNWSAVEPVDVLTGGFPCQDVSAAGERAGMKPGTRSGLWSHMAYAISQLRPPLVVIENVRGLFTARGAAPTAALLAAWDARDRCDRTLTYLKRARSRAHRSDSKEFLHRVQVAHFRYLGRRRRAVAAARRADALIVRAIGTVLGDLASLGFDAEWVSLPAAAVGCPHLRWRVFVVASDADGVGSVRDRGSRRRRPGSADHDLAAPNTAGDGRHEGRTQPARFERGSDAALGGDAVVSDGGIKRGDTETSGPSEVLRDLRRSDGTQEIRQESGTGRSDPIPQTQELFSSLRQQQEGGAGRDLPLARQETQEGSLRRMSDDRGSTRPSHRSGSDEQRSGESSDAVFLLSSQAALAGGSDEAGLVPTEAARSSRNECGVPQTPEMRGTAVSTVPGCAQASHERIPLSASSAAWGCYVDVVRRWEIVLGRNAPLPTELSPKGTRRLSPSAVEFLMGLPAGHVTGVEGLSRNDMLKILGNGVVPLQAAAAVRYLLPLLQAEDRAA